MCGEIGDQALDGVGVVYLRFINATICWFRLKIHSGLHLIKRLAHGSSI